LNFYKKIIPYLKVFLFNSANIETGVLENSKVLERLASLKKEHNLKIGLTTTGTNQAGVIKKALNITADGASLFDSFQVTYNFLDQSLFEISEELIHQNKSIVIKEALANGRVFRNQSYPHYTKMYEVLESISKKHNVGVDAISLKYCEQTIPNSIVLSGASTNLQLKQNLQLNTFSLSNNEIELLNSFKTSKEFYWKERKQLIWN
jgi:aryl-alcohol dehydrogenase-like predicted oxidoreductase